MQKLLKKRAFPDFDRSEMDWQSVCYFKPAFGDAPRRTLYTGDGKKHALKSSILDTKHQNMFQMQMVAVKRVVFLDIFFEGNCDNTPQSLAPIESWLKLFTNVDNIALLFRARSVYDEAPRTRYDLFRPLRKPRDDPMLRPRYELWAQPLLNVFPAKRGVEFELHLRREELRNTSYVWLMIQRFKMAGHKIKTFEWLPEYDVYDDSDMDTSDDEEEDWRSTSALWYGDLRRTGYSFLEDIEYIQSSSSRATTGRSRCPPSGPHRLRHQYASTTSSLTSGASNRPTSTKKKPPSNYPPLWPASQLASTATPPSIPSSQTLMSVRSTWRQSIHPSPVKLPPPPRAHDFKTNQVPPLHPSRAPRTKGKETSGQEAGGVRSYLSCCFGGAAQ
jgi:hypothetical protein